MTKTNASKLRKRDSLYVLQPKANHRGSKILLRGFRWTCAFYVEKLLPNNKYLIRKVETDKTRVIHRMILRSFTPREPILDVKTLSQELNSDPEVVIETECLYVRAWECEHETPIFDENQVAPDIPNSPEVAVQSNVVNDEAGTI